QDARARRVPRIAPWSDWIDFEATVGTARDQIAVLPGTLRRSWTQGDRRYFHYRTDSPILNFFSLLSAEYAVREARWKDIEIRVLHHPDHSFNVDRAVRNVQASLDYFTDQFGPYPYRQLSMVEFPGYGRGARAYAGQIIYSEADPIAVARMDAGAADRVDYPLAVTAHEVAHQWWGQQVMGADVQGSQMLSETLAQYSAVMVLERTHGAEHARRSLLAMHEQYLNGRGRNATAEVPLLFTTAHGYILYGKGPVVMYALQDYIGEERVNTALRRLVKKYGKQEPPYPTTLDLYEELRAVTPDSLRYLLRDLLATITLWDLRATGARAMPSGSGHYLVTLNVEAAKLRSDSVGNDTEVPMNDLVEIGVFAEDKNGEGLGEPLYLRKHRIHSGQQAITITVPGRPARAGIDPYHKLIARHADALYTSDIKLAEVNIDGHPGSVSTRAGSGAGRSPRAAEFQGNLTP
ncbi:MAG TPA: M1 family aminopeptidase, partial [Chloroflexota bacterium]|nr:M1 family aminopeptidase [Chloroflexota bacterium]